MKRTIIFFLLVQLSCNHFGQIIADHSVVDKYAAIPKQWIDSVKTMWVVTAGASHAEAYRIGCEMLNQSSSRYPVYSQWQGDPAPYRNTHLRINTITWGNYDNPTGWQYRNGQKDWWTNSIARARVKAGLMYCHENGPDLYAILYGWSFDATWDNPPGGNYSSVYHTRWAGSTREGPQGNLRWGLTSADQSVTGNSVCMDTYIDSQHEYIDFCSANNIPTKIIWSNGAVDNEQNWAIGESGYQQFLKWEHIRKHVKSLDNAYFIDYADILSYNNTGEQATTTWTDKSGVLRTFPIIHPENMEGGDIGHIGRNGALKLGKAIWWLLARMAGWDGLANDISEEITNPGLKVDINAGKIEVFLNHEYYGKQVELVNLSGKSIEIKVVNGYYCQFNTSSLPQGIYFVSIKEPAQKRSIMVYVP